MTFEDYKSQVEGNAREAIAEGASRCGTWDEMYDALFTDDAVTGNGSGSYFFNAWKATEAASGLVFDEGFIAEARAAGYGMELFAEGPETVDVAARCLALELASGALEAAYKAAREGAA